MGAIRVADMSSVLKSLGTALLLRCLSVRRYGVEISQEVAKMAQSCIIKYDIDLRHLFGFSKFNRESITNCDELA